MSKCDGGCLSSVVVHLMRELTEEYLGFNCAFVDDEMRLVCCLAQRAVLAGLADDAVPNTLRLFEEAAERHRPEHEKALGFAIVKQPPPLQTRSDG